MHSVGVMVLSDVHDLCIVWLALVAKIFAEDMSLKKEENPIDSSKSLSSMLKRE